MLAFFNMLVSMWPNVMGALQFTWPYVIKYWKELVAVILIATNIFFYNSWQHTSDSLAAEKAVHAQDIASYRRAQADAQAKADATRARLLKESKEKADEADQNYTNLYAMYRTNLLRYQALASSRSGSSGDSHSGTPEVLDGPGASTLVPVTAEDLNICAINTARLQSAHEWALNLKEVK